MKYAKIFLNKKELLERFQGDEDFIKELLQVFLEQEPERMKKLDSSWAKANWQNIMELTHSIKGTASNIAAWELKKAAFELENACKNNQQSEEIKQRLRNLKQKFEQTVRVVEMELYK